MNCVEFHARILLPAHAFLREMHAQAASADAARFLLAIAGQESGWSARAQLNGPARGFWQFEPAGVLAVMQNAMTQQTALAAAHALAIGIDRASLYLAIQHNDALAYTLARLLVLPEPAALPITQDDAWAQYLRVWRPGKPRPDDWPGNWNAAVAAIAQEN